jgi:acetyl/propionyl-CoA carboxylase alpha subunit
VFERLLIANRGEIATRIARTCRRMGIRAIGLYSDDDRENPHLELMDDAVHLPGSTPQLTYLNQEAVLAAAKSTGCAALHPGYGFLSEHPEFVQRCEAAGLTFIGPSSHHIALMGEKRRARDAFKSAGFPLVPRYDIEDGRLPEDASYPVMVKAAAGGGGIGMTLVTGPEEVERALKRVSQAGERFFGSGELYAERYLAGARHVEIQVAGDGSRAVHLGERDCSWQRRYQKVIEESPAPNLPSGLAAALATHAAEAVGRLGYENVGTVECLVLGDEYFFLEMNTRIQVEHGVTELVQGVDLVLWQLQIAAGGGIPGDASGDGPNGHAIEVRIYAEDPRTFLPSPGTLTEVVFPRSEGIRVDTAVRSGTRLSPHYDPMIAKLIVHGPDRPAAIARLREALLATRLEGVKTNVPFLSAAIESPEFVSGVYDTRSLGRLALA